MFPYQIRKPAWGSLKPKPSKQRRRKTHTFDAASHLRVGGDPNDDPRSIGGNLQRAILLDLIELRQRYFDAESRHFPPANGAAVASKATADAASSSRASTTRGGSNQDTCTGNQQRNTRNINHASLGSSFTRFKTCFREARFGANHTRTIPPRVDRGEYVQLLYSSCFYLLEESFQYSHSSATPLSWENSNGTCQNSAFNAIFAAFVLYTLHQTNVLPEVPQPRSNTKRTKSGKFDKKSLEEAWSMLAIGINSDEDKLYRRTFRSPVRIDRWNYLLLMRLRDICCSRVDRCSLGIIENTTNDNNITAADECNDTSCCCGLARDAAHIIDKMLFDDTFFEYCEYHGPHGLEGLAGNPNFYRAYFASRGQEATLAPSTPVEIFTGSKLNTVGSEDDISSSLELQDLASIVDSHRTNLASVMTEVHKSRMPGRSTMQPKQRELVESTLKGIMQPTSYQEMVEKLNVAGRPTEKAHVASYAKDEAKPPPEKIRRDKSKVDIVKFPDTFSSELCDGIRGALFNFKEEVEMVRKAVVKENRANMKRDQMENDIDLYSEQSFFGDLVPCPRGRKRRASEMSNSNAVESTVSDQSKKQRQRDTFLELKEPGLKGDSAPTNLSGNADELSVATGVGKNALQLLLSKAEDYDIESRAKDLLSIFDDDDDCDDESMSMNDNLSVATMAEGYDDNKSETQEVVKRDDESSVATGAGKKALLSLLSKANMNNESKLMQDEILARDDDDSELLSQTSMMSNARSLVPDGNISVSSEMGKKALQLLLSKSTKEQGRKQAVNAPHQKLPSSRKVKNKVLEKKAQSCNAKKSDSTSARPVQQNDGCGNRDEFLETSNTTLSNPQEDNISVATGAGKNALLSLLSMAKGDDVECSTHVNAAEKDDECSVAAGADNLEDGSVSSNNDKSDLQSASMQNKPRSSNQRYDEVSFASEISKTTLEHYLPSQSLKGEDETAKPSIVEKRAEKKTSHQESHSRQTTSKEKNAKPTTSKKKEPPSLRLAQRVQPESVNENQEHDDYDENSAITGRSNQDEFSVATEDAGRNALAALLSNVVQYPV